MKYYSPLTREIHQSRPQEWSIPLEDPRPHTTNTSFVGDFQFCWDSVSLGLLKTCPRKYDYTIRQGYSIHPTPSPLSFGIYFHKCIEVWHKLLAQEIPKAEALLSTTKLAGLLGETILPGRTERTKETLVRAVVWYLAQFYDDSASTALHEDGTPAVEMHFQLPITTIQLPPSPTAPSLDLTEVYNYFLSAGSPPSQRQLIHALRGGVKLFGRLTGLKFYSQYDAEELNQAFYSISIYLAGHLDRVVHFHNQVYLLDYKTTKSQLNDRFISGFKPNTQISGYLAAGHILAAKPTSVFPSPPAGLIIDGIELGVTYTRFQRFQLPFTELEADDWLADFKSTIQVKALGYAAAQHWPMEETSCTHYGGCEFKSVCAATPPSRQRILNAHFCKSTWDPQQPREF